MKNKRFLVIGIALILLASVAGVVIAQESGNFGGVSWRRSGDSTIMVNSNDYGVGVMAVYDNGRPAGNFWFEAKQSRTLDGHLKIQNVSRIKPANPR